MLFVKPVSRGVQLALIAVGYGVVFVIAAAWLYQRHLFEIQDPVAASGGMAAFGDTILYVFIGFLFLVPTVFLIRIIAKTERVYTAFAKLLFGLGLSAPVCMTVVLLGDHMPARLSWICGWRMLESPIIFLGMGVSRWVARFDRAKKLTSYALLLEGLTLGLPIGAFIVALFLHR